MIVNVDQTNSDGVRADIYALEKLKERGFETLSRTFLHRVFKDVVKINSVESKESYRLKRGDIIEISEKKIEAILQDQNNSGRIVAQQGNLDIFYETEQYLILNKPKGVSVHPGIKNVDSTLANFVRGYLEKKKLFDLKLNRAGLVHRLDKGVGGLMIFAKTPKAQRYFQKEFEEHRVKKIYRAKTVGECELPVYPEKIVNVLRKLQKNNFEMDDSWTLYEGYIGRDRRNRLRMQFRKEKFPNSKKSISYIKRIAKDEFLVNILTGRMHQIRATLAYVGVPIQGDTLYSQTKKNGIPEHIELESVLLSFKDMEGELVTFSLY